MLFRSEQDGFGLVRREGGDQGDGVLRGDRVQGGLGGVGGGGPGGEVFGGDGQGGAAGGAAEVVQGAWRAMVVTQPRNPS